MSSRENLPNICGTTSHSTSTLTNFVLTIICVHVIDAQDSQYHLSFPAMTAALTFIVQFKKIFTLYSMLCMYTVYFLAVGTGCPQTFEAGFSAS